LVGVSRVSELQDLCGPGTVASMPEAVAALSTGAREVLVSAVAGGTAATATLMNSAEAPAVRLRARSRGAWANQLSVDVGTVTNADGNLVRVTLRILQNSQEVERFDDLIVEPGQRQDLFSVINAQSNYVVAVEPNFDGDDPKPGTYPLGAEGSVAVEQRDAAGTVLMDVKLKPGAPSDGVAVTIAGEGDAISLEVRRNGARQEFFEDLTMDPDSARHLPALLSAEQIRARRAPQLAGGSAATAAGHTGPGGVRRRCLTQRRRLPQRDRLALRRPAHRPGDGMLRSRDELGRRDPDPPGAARARPGGE
jgi:hypothetical protein